MDNEADDRIAATGNLRGAVPLVRFFLTARIRPGDLAVDATCGNGQDTLLLAELVGPGGKVWALDIQEEAVARTGERIGRAGFGERVELVRGGHEHLGKLIPEPVQAIVFNLGYLPAGDREIRTDAATTASALEQAIKLLAPGGMVLIAVYTGHPGGPEEWAAVQSWGTALDPKQFNVWQLRQLNRSETAPFVIIVEKVPA